jgi:hypothetical protein
MTCIWRTSSGEGKGEEGGYSNEDEGSGEAGTGGGGDSKCGEAGEVAREGEGGTARLDRGRGGVRPPRPSPATGPPHYTASWYSLLVLM